MTSFFSFLDLYPSMLQPAVAIVLVASTLVLTALFVVRPSWLVPALIISTPIPKLYSIGVHTEIMFAGDYGLLRVPGGSVVDVVILSGVLAVLLKGVVNRRATRGPFTTLDRWTLMCGGVVFFSLALNMMLGTQGVDLPAWLYAVRYVAALVTFFLAKESASNAAYGIQDILRLTQWSGNIFIVLGLLFYFFGGGRAWVDPEYRIDILGQAERSGLFRTSMFFFDYGYDFGLYIVLIVLTNVLAFFRTPFVGLKLANGFFAVLGVLSVLLLVERGNYVALIAAVGALPVMLAQARKQDIIGATMKSMAASVVILAVSVVLFFAVAPPAIATKIDQSRGVAQDANELIELSQDLGLSRGLTEVVAALPVGDFAFRLLYMSASLREAIRRPWGIGFWCEITAVGWYAHNDLVKIFVELGVLGLAAFGMMFRSLWRELGDCMRTTDRDQIASMAMVRAYLFGLAVTMLFGTGVVMLLKVTGFIWSFIGALLGTAVRPLPFRERVKATSSAFRPVLVRPLPGPPQ